MSQSWRQALCLPEVNLEASWGGLHLLPRGVSLGEDVPEEGLLSGVLKDDVFFQRKIGENTL